MIARNTEWPAVFPEDALAAALAGLPVEARRRYERIEAGVADVQALVNVAQARMRTAEERYTITAERAGRAVQARDAEATAAARAELEPLRAEYAEAERERDRRAATLAERQQAHLQLKRFLMGGVPLCRFVGDSPAKPRKGESVLQALQRVRNAITRASGEIARTRNAPPPADAIKQQLRDEVQRKAKAGAPRVRLEGDAVRVEWPDAHGYGTGAPALAASNLLCWLFAEQMFAALGRGFDQKGGLSADERAARIAELEGEIRRLELEEESLIEQAIAAGADVQRRPNASGYALLQIEALTQSELEARAAATEAAA